MGCGGSKGTEVATTAPSDRRKSGGQDSNHAKTSTSSSGISSYRDSQSPGGQEPDRDLNQNKAEQGTVDTEPVSRHQEIRVQQLAAELQNREGAAEGEEETRRQEQASATAEEEQRRQAQQEKAQAEEAAARRREEARQQEAASLARDAAALAQPDQTRGSEEKGGGGRSFTPLEIAQHNAEVGWKEWIAYRRKVYDGNGFKNYFPGYMQNRNVMLETRARQRVAEGSEEEETEFVTFTHPFIYASYWNPTEAVEDLSLDNPQVWTINGVTVLRANDISEEEIAKELPPFLLGTITCREGPLFFDGFRKEVSIVLEDLQTSSDDTTPSIVQDYVAQLIRWQDKYKDTDPLPSPASDGTDPNAKRYQLPVDPESLRLFVLKWEPMNLEIPPEGAWQRFELENTDLGDPHETFLSSLRDGFATEELSFDIEGGVAWEVLPDDAIKEEQMTPEQKEVQAARDKRTDLNDLERMKKRRQQLCDYFIQTRELAPDVVMAFLQWASLLEASQAQLDKLCQEEQS